MSPVCRRCGKDINPGLNSTWHHVEGWERPGQAGGSDIVLRRRTGKGYMHPDCMQEERGGINVNQIALGEEDEAEIDRLVEMGVIDRSEPPCSHGRENWWPDGRQWVCRICHPPARPPALPSFL